MHLCVSVRRGLSSVGLRRRSRAAVQRCPPAPALRARGPAWGWGSARGADAGAQSWWVHVLICELKRHTWLPSGGSDALVVAGARPQGGNYIEMRQQSPRMHIAIGVGAEHHVLCCFKLCTLCTLHSISFSPGNGNCTKEGLKPNSQPFDERWWLTHACYICPMIWVLALITHLGAVPYRQWIRNRSQLWSRNHLGLQDHIASRYTQQCW